MKNNWPTKKLGEVVDIRIGGTPSRNNPQYWGGENPWGTISDLNGQALYETKEYITELGVDNSNVKPIPAGTTLMSFKLTIGKVATAGTEIYTNEAIAGLVPKTSEVENKWLFYSLPTVNYDKYLSGAAKGKTLNKAILQEVEIPVPSIVNQQKIVERLDAIRKAQELCGIQIQKTEELFDSVFRNIFKDNHKNWREVTLAEISSKLGDGLHGTPKYISNGNYYFINGNNLEDGAIKYKENTKRVSPEEFTKYKKDLNNRTILVSINGTLGNVAFYNNEKVVLGKSICYINLMDKVDKDFVKYILSSMYFMNYARSEATGATIKNFSLKSMRAFKIYLPTIQLQKEIVKKLDAIQDYKKLLLKQKSLLKELFDSVLQKSMSGEMDK